MKKLLVLVFALILAASALIISASAVDYNDYVGTWVKSHDKDDGGAIAELFHLSESGTLFYLNQLFGADDIGFGRQYIGYWKETPNGIYMKFGNNAESDAVLSADGFLMVLFSDGTAMPYGKVSEYNYGG